MLTLRTSFTLLAVAPAVTVLGFGSTLLVLLAVPALQPVAADVLGVAVFVLSAAVLALMALVLRRAGLGWRAVGFARPGRRFLHLLWQAPLVLLAVLVVQSIVLGLIGLEPTRSGRGTFTGISPAAAVLAVAGVAILVPLWEEITFRGVLLGLVGRRWGVVVAVVTSSIAFAVLHAVPILLPYLFTVGLALALLRLWHRNLWASVAAHSLINSIAVAVAVTATR